MTRPFRTPGKTTLSVFSLFLIFLMVPAAYGVEDLDGALTLQGTTLPDLEISTEAGKDLARPVEPVLWLERYGGSTADAAGSQQWLGADLRGHENPYGKVFGGQSIRYRFDSRTGEIQALGTERRLSAMALEAIEKSPSWLRDQLRNRFLDFYEWDQDPFAQRILAPGDERYTDEIAFVFAYLPYRVLNVGFDPDLLVENAAAIYLNDEHLDYVEVVDYGAAGVDDDYYSTTRYTALRDGPRARAIATMTTLVSTPAIARCRRTASTTTATG